jgi:hypothetical protein
MAMYFELWNDETNNMIDEFDTVEQVLNEVRWRIAVQSENEACMLSMLQRDDSGTIQAVVHGDELVRRVRETAVTAD